MLRLIKKHLAACSKRSETDWKCRTKDGSKASCPFYIVGPDPSNPTGPRIKKHTGTSAEQTARAVLIDFERSLFDPRPKSEPVSPPKRTIADVIESYLLTKKFRSADRQKRLHRLLMKMAAFLKENRREFISDVTKEDLEKFMFSWSGATSTLKTQRENMKSFWLYCDRSDYTKKNVSAALPSVGDDRVIKVNRQRIPTLTDEEIRQVIGVLDQCGDLFRREGDKVASQVKAFTLIQRYTGMAVGDVTKLRLDEVNRNQIVVSRKKTGERVWTIIPEEAVEALQAFAPDSPEYFFWSGRGEHHTRTTKWGNRLKKLYAFADLRVTHVSKRRRSGGILKDNPDLVKVSSVTPHYWRHTFVRDHYLIRTPVEQIAELIGDDPETVRRYYSSFDTLRQEKLISHQKDFFEFAKQKLNQATS